MRAELRTRSQDLNKELLDLVNHNYQDFLGLGSSLKGGDEKVEEVRLGLLGFRREIAALKKRVGERRQDIEQLIAERRTVRQNIQQGRRLLELDKRINELEQRLQLTLDVGKKPALSNGVDHESSDEEEDIDSEDEEDGDDPQIPVRRLRRRVDELALINQLSDSLGRDQPFVKALEARTSHLRKTLLLDLAGALKQAIALEGAHGTGHLTLTVLATFSSLGESKEATKIVKELKAGRRR